MAGYVQAGLEVLRETCPEAPFPGGQPASRDRMRALLRGWTLRDPQQEGQPPIFERVPYEGRVDAIVDCWIVSRRQLEALPEYAAALAALRSDEMIRPQIDALVGTSRQAHRLQADDVLASVLTGVARLSGSFEWSEEAFSESYEHVESALYDDQISGLLLVPLRGLDSLPHAPIDLQGGVVLDEMTEPEAAAVLSSGLPGAMMMRNVAILTNRYAIKLHYSESKLVNPYDAGVATEDPEAAARSEMVDRLITALRLYKSGRIGPIGFLTLHEGWLFEGSVSWIPAPEWTAGGAAYSLSEPDLAELGNLWDLLNDDAVRSSGPLMAACRRFGYSNDRERHDDRVVDLMIAAESLFLSDVGEAADRGELSFRLALRAARFLDEEGDPRRAIFDTFRRGYRVRSSIVHGDEPDPKDLKGIAGGAITLQQFAETVEEQMRKALQRAIRSRPAGDFPPQWNELVLS